MSRSSENATKTTSYRVRHVKPQDFYQDIYEEIFEEVIEGVYSNFSGLNLDPRSKEHGFSDFPREKSSRGSEGTYNDSRYREYDSRDAPRNSTRDTRESRDSSYREYDNREFNPDKSRGSSNSSYKNHNSRYRETDPRDSPREEFHRSREHREYSHHEIPRHDRENLRSKPRAPGATQYKKFEDEPIEYEVEEPGSSEDESPLKGVDMNIVAIILVGTSFTFKAVQLPQRFQHMESFLSGWKKYPLSQKKIADIFHHMKTLEEDYVKDKYLTMNFDRIYQFEDVTGLWEYWSLNKDRPLRP